MPLEFNEMTAPHQIPFVAYGVEARIVASSRQLLARMEMLLPPSWRPVAPSDDHHAMGIIVESDGTHSVYNGSTRVSEAQGLELSLMMLDGQLRSYVALNSPHMTFVHAGVVAHEGVAIVFPGYSFAGKTTLAAAFVEAGAIYYSDEFAVFDGEGLVHPYAKTLSLRPGSSFEQVERSAESLGGVAGTDPIPLGLVVITHFRPGAEWEPRELSAGETVMGLIQHTVTVRSRPEVALQALTRGAVQAVGLEGPRGEAHEIVELLLARASPIERPSAH